MAQSMTRINCPSCGQAFAAPLEQILDVQLDPSAKARVLAGQVNVVICPQCGAGGMINSPFLYHDPVRELALVLMPMEAGRTDLERQQIIGTLSRAVMNQLPSEQRKSYLLNPEVFLTHESLLNRLLEAEGVTPEMVEAQEARAELLRKLMDASAEERVGIIEENTELFDEEFFQILQINSSRAESVGQEELLTRIGELQQQLFETTKVGRALASRSEAVKALQEEPTREKLIELLAESQDEVTREVLIAISQPLLDYAFFQSLTQRIEKTKDAAAKKALEALRAEVMDVREQMQEQARLVVEDRANLLRDLMLTEQPELLLRRHLAEIDELFFGILSSEIEQAKSAGNAEAVERLEAVRKLTLDIMRSMIPPEMLLLSQLMEAEDAEAARKLLEANARIVTPPLAQMLRQVEQDMREQDRPEVAERAARALSIVESMLPPQDSGLVTA
jgi:hypothetical protein